MRQSSDTSSKIRDIRAWNTSDEIMRPMGRQVYEYLPHGRIIVHISWLALYKVISNIYNFRGIPRNIVYRIPHNDLQAASAFAASRSSRTRL